MHVYLLNVTTTIYTVGESYVLSYNMTSHINQTNSLMS